MSISESDFIEAIEKLAVVWSSIPNLGGEPWQSVDIVQSRGFIATPYLNLTKLVPSPTSRRSSRSASSPRKENEHAEEDQESEFSEDDPESLPPASPSSSQFGVLITYTIHYHPSYQVPTLYITPPLSTSSTAHPLSLSELSTLLIPALHAPSMQNPSIGPFGALSPTTHPETGRSCLWVHPCLTQEGMAGLELSGEDGLRYLMGWIGMLGSGVGLELTIEIARILLGE